MSIPVLMYHHILPKTSFIASSIEEFEKQMRFLSKNNYKTLTSSEFLEYKKGKTFPKKSVFITFDDGWRDNYYFAYPILKKYNIKVTIFLVTEWIEKASNKKEDFEALPHNKAKELIKTDPSKVVLNWDEIEKMTDLVDFHSHTHSHTDNYFDTYSWEEEFILSKEILKKRLNIDSTHLCWPRGKYSKDLIKLAKSLGYEIFYTTKRGINLRDNNLDEIKRVAVKKDNKWLKKQLTIFSNPLLGYLYAKVKPE